MFNLVPNKLNLGYMNLYWPYSPFKFISFGITIVKSVIRPKLKRVVVSEPTKLYTHTLSLSHAKNESFQNTPSTLWSIRKCPTNYNKKIPTTKKCFCCEEHLYKPILCLQQKTSAVLPLLLAALNILIISTNTLHL